MLDVYFSLLEWLPFLSKDFRLVGYSANVTAIIRKVSLLEWIENSILSSVIVFVKSVQLT